MRLLISLILFSCGTAAADSCHQEVIGYANGQPQYLYYPPGSCEIENKLQNELREIKERKRLESRPKARTAAPDGSYDDLTG